VSRKGCKAAPEFNASPIKKFRHGNSLLIKNHQRPIIINDRLIGVLYHDAVIEITDHSVISFDLTTVPRKNSLHGSTVSKLVIQTQ
jgi:hypothetical protein